MDKQFHRTFYWACGYLVQLVHVDKSVMKISQYTFWIIQCALLFHDLNLNKANESYVYLWCNGFLSVKRCANTDKGYHIYILFVTLYMVIYVHIYAMQYIVRKWVDSIKHDTPIQNHKAMNPPFNFARGRKEHAKNWVSRSRRLPGFVDVMHKYEEVHSSKHLRPPTNLLKS